MADPALRGSYYAECQKVFRAATNQDEMMLEAVQVECADYEEFSILSVGSGSGLFELPMLKLLLASGKKIRRFVGVDIDEDANQLLKEALDAGFAGLLDYEVVPASFDAFEAGERAEIILYNHVFEYIREGHLAWMQKSLDLLAEGGRVLLFSPIAGGINALYEENMRAHFDYAPYYSDDIEEMLTEAGMAFSKERIRGECGISLLDELGDNADGMRLLSFLTQVDCRALPSKQKAEQVSYFQSLAEQGEKRIPHPTDFFVLPASA